MIPGIEIISKTEITTLPTPYFIIMMVLWLLFFISLFLCFIRPFAKDRITAGHVLILVFSIFALICGTASKDTFLEPTGRYEYIAYIDNTVSMLEFNEKYNVISVDDNVYTFQDKITEEKEIK